MNTPDELRRLAGTIRKWGGDDVSVGEMDMLDAAADAWEEAITIWQSYADSNRALAEDNTSLRQRLEAADRALRIADVHVGWGDCTLENVHNIIRAALAGEEK